MSEERRVVNINVKPCDGVDPQALYKKIKETIGTEPDYKLKWEESCKVENGEIVTSFTLDLAADFDEIMEAIECMEGEVANQQVTFQMAME